MYYKYIIDVCVYILYMCIINRYIDRQTDRPIYVKEMTCKLGCGRGILTYTRGVF